MRKTLLSIATATALTLGTVAGAPAATAAEPAPANLTELSSKAPQLISNAGPFGLIALLGGGTIAVYAVLKVLGDVAR
ncbi:hypothetical protein MHY13_03410 [Corynebacterium sp. ACRPE]|uniref:hypothetical protein n=1 Tax=Corynebacterium sp. ACRPE TaxID=2918196 RepID=UPI001EF67EF3|nr:hypothetical protein [Corynebacterium sp. ACRPE]MCG7467181.1 hypothetical protein [Corynebacterium sp. ACRPE]